MSSDEGWSHLNNIIFDRRQFKLRVRYLSHWDMIRSCSFWTHILQLPSVVIGSVAATAAFTTIQKENENEIMKFSVAGLTALIAILSALSQYFKFPEEAEKHRDAALAYETLLHKVGAIRRAPPSSQDNFSDLILDIDNEYLKIKSVAPMLSENLIAKHASAESSIYTLNNENPHQGDIEAAVQESSSDQSEIDAINNESKSRLLERQVDSIMKHNNTLHSNNAVRAIITSLVSRRTSFYRRIISNWRSNLSNTLKVRQYNTEMETRQLHLDIERARAGVMREEVQTMDASTSQIAGLEQENNYLKKLVQDTEETLRRTQDELGMSQSKLEEVRKELAQKARMISDQDVTIEQLQKLLGETTQ